VLPNQDQVTTAKVVTVAQEVRRPKLRLGEDLLTIALEHVVRERGPALEDLIAKPGGPLREQLADTYLVFWYKRRPFHWFVDLPGAAVSLLP
jgi:hypothetical protein